ncbi:DNA-binding protein [Niabella sp. CC-SYL272]|uniref:glycosyl hydrolase n=1 Tax=Niabella agricola TaxID=2891571 RepID=UPI001F1DF9E4|nr:glycosyl hydrolase [Niabella agricola]MCF3111699.1 DNA-binding protein [Niabella agricola]
MRKNKMKKVIIWQLLLGWCCLCCGQMAFGQHTAADVKTAFTNPPEQARPWVFWYWMHAAVSKEGITADLESMKSAGIGGAYLMPIGDTSAKLPFDHPVRQLTPEWWGMVNHAMKEAKRLNLKLAMHFSDGFALGGGPWITPERSMQKITWSKRYARSEANSPIKLDQPETNEGYYRDIAVFAYPAKSNAAFTGENIEPRVTTSTGVTADFLALPDVGGKQSFKTDTDAWIRYEYPRPFTARSVRIHIGGNNYQALRLVVQSSNDGIHFKTITQLEPPRHGWQDTDADYTFSLPGTSAKYFRFVYDKTGSEPGAEDLDAAKWKPSLKVMGIYLDDEPVINQYEAKNGSIWRVAANTDTVQVPDRDAVPLKSIVDLSSKMSSDGTLHWIPPAGNWVIVRIGHTSTGHVNATGGAGKGLECDKFDPEAIQLQFNNWFAKAFEKTDPGLAKDVLKVFHVDSWECGSQNWSRNFLTEFQQRRGYDLRPWLLVMTGVPLESAVVSEQILHDVRNTIAELVQDIFYKTLKALAHEKGTAFSAESVAPTMVSDGLMHYQFVDIPMGEFWLNSPTHDKPNDMLDAISGAHIYGKNIIQAEAFTTLRMDWSEHPGNIKVLGDRNFAMGINKMVLHVFAHNPFLSKKPGVTLDGVGLYFQRDQTWMQPGKAWIDYLARTSALLQLGKPVSDIAVFTGTELPRRSVLPERLVQTLPGLFGAAAVAYERQRMENKGAPVTTRPSGVLHAANMADPGNYVNALHGYKYDCFNPDVLLQMRVERGRVVTPGGASYAVLVIPGRQALNPNNRLLPVAIAQKIRELVHNGATVIMEKGFEAPVGFKEDPLLLRQVLKALYGAARSKGRLVTAPFRQTDLSSLGLKQDVEVLKGGDTIAWAHRSLANGDLYFISNPFERKRTLEIAFRVKDGVPQLLDAVTGTVTPATDWRRKAGRTVVRFLLEPNAAVFVHFQKREPQQASIPQPVPVKERVIITGNWEVTFDPVFGGPHAVVSMPVLKSWDAFDAPAIKYYSGTAIYKNQFDWKEEVTGKPVWLELDSLYNLATITVNGVNCGTIWTYPLRMDISKALKKGTNMLEIAVTNTWANRLIGDQQLPEAKRLTWTTAPFRLQGKPLLPAGLKGEVRIVQ